MLPDRIAVLASLWLVSALALPFAACTPVERAGCLSAGTDCVPPSPCERLAFTCASPRATVVALTDPAQRPAGLSAQAARGDFVMSNGVVTVVIDAVDHPNHLAPTGGNILDLAPDGGADHINQIYAVSGILPRDAAHYDSVEIVPGGTNAVVLARGTLDGDRAVRVTTRYELRPCDPGVRVRTEMLNTGRTPWAQMLTDAHWFGDRGLTPFVPLRAQGYSQPPLNLLDLDPGWRQYPWVAASSHTAPQTSYSIVACNRPTLGGFCDARITATGTERAVILAGDGVAFERMIFAAPGAGVEGAAALALEARRQLFDEAVTTVTGRIVGSDGVPIGGDERRAAVIVYEALPPPVGVDRPSPAMLQRPLVEVIPASDGTFSAHVPAGLTYGLRVSRHGMLLATTVAPTTAPGFGDIVVDPLSHMAVTVTDAATSRPLDAEIIVLPTSATPRDQVHGTENGYFDRNCAPYLGPPHAGSPACNRALAFGGSASFELPPGTYWVYATAGPARTLARQQVSVAMGTTQSVALALRDLPGIFPPDALAADFHVHSGRSFDITFPTSDRVKTFITSGVQVIAATEHDVVGNFDRDVQALGVQNRVVIMPGVEATPAIPWFYPPGGTLPKVIGHVGAWPMQYDPLEPRDGAPWDELALPGTLFDRLAGRMVVGEQGVLQLNHPTAASQIGRDLGWLRMIHMDPRQPLPGRDDGSIVGLLYATPAGATHTNMGWDAQEVMQGQGLLYNVQYRAVWHALLDHGIMRTGTANSDSHSLTEEQLGYPRNIVLTGFPLAQFNRVLFNTAVREGRIVGTNGAFIDAHIRDGTTAHGPALAAFAPGPGATLEVSVRAAPWIPLEEVRIVVNGTVVRTIDSATMMHPTDPFGTATLERWRGTFPVSELMGGRDGWISVETGYAIPISVDHDNDGLTDAIDINRNGVAELQLNPDNSIAHAEIDDANSPPPETDARFHVWVVSPGTWPMAFTNPFVLNMDGGAWTAPGVPR